MPNNRNARGRRPLVILVLIVAAALIIGATYLSAVGALIVDDPDRIPSLPDAIESDERGSS